jgi:putative ABC transport system permease protein
VLKSVVPNLTLRFRPRASSLGWSSRRGWELNGALGQDLRFLTRGVRRRPVFYLAIILVFSLGIGANTIIFSVIDGVLLDPLPFPEADRLVVPWQTDPDERESPNPVERALADRTHLSFPLYQDWVERNSVFESLGAYRSLSFYALRGDRVERVLGAQVTHGVFAALKVPPFMGRTFVPEDDDIRGPRLAILGHGWWQQGFGSDSTIVGRGVILGGESYTVVGVMPPGFRFPGSADVWVNMSQPDHPMFTDRDANVLFPLARLRPGISLDQAQSEMAALAEVLKEEKPIPGKDRGVNVVLLHNDVVGRVRPGLLFLVSAVGTFLLFACANIANLLMVRASERRAEMVVRLSLGAGRGRIARQVLTEGLALSVAGGLLGTVTAFLLHGPFLSLLPTDTPRLDEINLDHGILAFSALLTVLSGIAVSVFPVLRLLGPGATVLTENGFRTAGGRRRNRVEAGLLVSQLAMAFVFLFAAGLLIRSFDRLTSVDRGFEAEGVVVLDVDMGGFRYAGEAEPPVVFQELLNRLEAIPGVTSLGTTHVGPFLGTSTRDLIVETAQGQVTRSTHFDFVSSDYFRTMGISLLEGRSFLPFERYASHPVVVVNEEVAEAYWPDESALGKTIGDSDAPGRTIVGVVRDTRHRLDRDPFSLVFYPPPEWSYPTIVLKAGVDPNVVMRSVRATVGEVDEAMAVRSLRRLEDTIRSSVAGTRVRTVLLGALAILAGVLAVVGVFSVLSYSVEQRTREIGIRMALGADSQEVVGGLVRRTLAYLSGGIVIGLAIAVSTSGLLRQFLFDTRTLSPWTLLSVILLLGTTAILAAAIPALRAAAVDPVQALKQE